MSAMREGIIGVAPLCWLEGDRSLPRAGIPDNFPAMDALHGILSWIGMKVRKVTDRLRVHSSANHSNWPGLAPAESISADPAEHAVDFCIRWYDRLEIITRNRLIALGVPDNQIGAFDHDFELRHAAFHPKERTGGGISPGARINLNSGIFNPDLLVGHPGPGVTSMWEKARLRDRFDAVTAHEFSEGRGLSHAEAERRAADTELSVTDGARRILRAMADGGH